MSRSGRGRENDYSRHESARDERRSRFSEEVPTRVCISSISTKNLSHREIIDWMSRYGRVLDVGLFERHLLVQFDRENEAKRAVDREKGQSYRGNRFDIRLAYASDGQMGRQVEPRGRSSPRESRDMSPLRERSPLDRSRERFVKGGPVSERHMNSPEGRRYDRSRGSSDDTRMPPPGGFRPEVQDPNFTNPPFTDQITTERPGFDAAIIVMSSELLRYAETIEAKLQRQIALTTHIIVLKEESHANACVEDLTNKGVLYAFIVNTINEKHSSCTLRILYGNPQEHRNMPLAGALDLVAKNFENYQKRVRELKMIAPKPSYDPSRMPPGFIAPDDKIIYYCHLLADSRMLTIDELEKVVEFVNLRIQALAKAEGLESEPSKTHQLSGMQKQLPPTSNPNSTMLGGVRDEKVIAMQNQLHSKINHIFKAPGTSGTMVNSGMDSMVNASSGMPMGHGYGDTISHPTSTSNTSTNFLQNPTVQQALDNLMHSQFRPNTGNVGGSGSNISESSIDDHRSGGVMPPGSGNYNSMMNRGIPKPNQSSSLLTNPSMNATGLPRHPGASTTPLMSNPYGGTGGAPNQFSNFYPQPPLGQPIYRARPPFARPQYPGY